ncbi:MAG: KDO2-lipid IV(A) lauroyltransferase [Motiliproteus sp.]|jgi:KDO2-lipid IV(A) lauroyltransferase
MKSLLVVPVLTLIGCLSLPLARALGSAIGALAYLFSARSARVTRENIDICLSHLSEAERRKLAYQSVLETARLAAEICVVWARKGEWIRRHILAYEANTLAESYLSEGKGLLVLAPHIGNWEVLGYHLASLGPNTNLYQPPRLSSLDRIVRNARQRFGARLVPADRKGLSQVLKTLKEGGISGILPDQTPQDANAGAFVPFFTEPAFTMTLVHKLIQKTGCRVVFAYARRVPGGFEIVFHKPPEAIYAADQITALTALNQGVEACVLDVPTQYQWEYKRFKKRPEGAVPRYMFDR